jgi:DNA-binding response OmpR family regulator
MRQLSTVHEIGRIDVVGIVCIGQCRPHHFLSDEILDIPGFKVSTELDYRRVGSASHGIPALIVIHDSLPPAELVDACRFIRRHWPVTRILVIHDREELLEDSLYDDRVGTGVTGKDLIARILFHIQTIDLLRLRDPQTRSQ